MLYYVFIVLVCLLYVYCINLYFLSLFYKFVFDYHICLKLHCYICIDYMFRILHSCAMCAFIV